jgi:xanthosine utilization system XapX-like protein
MLGILLLLVVFGITFSMLHIAVPAEALIAGLMTIATAGMLSGTFWYRAQAHR